MSKVILITGASRGFGKLWAQALLKRGDKVAATARDIKALDDLVSVYKDSILPVKLDVNDRTAGFEAVQKVKDHFGRIDVLINNAGYGVFGAIEETTEQQARDQFETNFFGLLWLSQAVLPIMREQKSGHIVQVSSFLGVTTLPILGVYNASKFAVEGLSETLAKEVAPFGIDITLIEPNGFATEWGNASAVQTVALPEYQSVRDAFYGTSTPEVFGKPEATVEPLLKIIDAPKPPLRVFFGKVAYPAVKQAYAEKLAEWEEWKQVAEDAHGN